MTIISLMCGMYFTKKYCRIEDVIKINLILFEASIYCFIFVVINHGLIFSTFMFVTLVLGNYIKVSFTNMLVFASIALLIPPICNVYQIDIPELYYFSFVVVGCCIGNYFHIILKQPHSIILNIFKISLNIIVVFILMSKFDKYDILIISSIMLTIALTLHVCLLNEI